MTMSAAMIERIAASRTRGRELMPDTIVCHDPRHGGALTARRYLVLHGITPPVVDQFMSLVAATYDLEMAADWTAAFSPIAVAPAPPKARLLSWEIVLKQAAVALVIYLAFVGLQATIAGVGQ